MLAQLVGVLVAHLLHVLYVCVAFDVYYDFRLLGWCVDVFVVGLVFACMLCVCLVCLFVVIVVVVVVRAHAV